MRDILERRLVQLEADSEDDVDNAKLSDYDISTLSAMASHVLELADSLPVEDPKFDSVLKIIKEKQTAENNKIILFSTFRHTLAYLKQKLRAEGLRVEQIDGSVKDDARYELRKQFELPKEDENAIDILLFTEVGSEGLDYQFCDMMINYDLPWNPMRIEQRIGRIDRRGQKSEVVNIYNVITNNTVDADIYERCLLRIGIFEKSIGECEAILSEIGAQVEKIAVNAKNCTLSMNLRFKNASNQLNAANEDMEPFEYMKLLRATRKTIQSALGLEAYRRYINLINDAGMDSERYQIQGGQV